MEKIYTQQDINSVYDEMNLQISSLTQRNVQLSLTVSKANEVIAEKDAVIKDLQTKASLKEMNI